MRGLCGTQWVAPDATTEIIPAAEDLIIDAQHRNRGLFLLIDRTLAQMAADLGHRTLLSLSANATTRTLQDVTGWTRVAAFERAVRESSLPRGGIAERPQVRRVRAKGVAIARRTGVEMPRRIAEMTADRILAGIAGASPHVRVAAEPEPAVFASLAPAPERFRQAHTEEFYRWRLRNPDRRYRYVYWADPAVRGFTILGHQPANPRRILIADAAAADPDILLELLRAVASAGRPSLTVLPGTLPDDVRTELADLGFSAPDESGAVESGPVESGPVESGSDEMGAEAMVVVFVRTTSRASELEARDGWDVPLLDTMLG
jgi:hypothetical protein